LIAPFGKRADSGSVRSSHAIASRTIANACRRLEATEHRRDVAERDVGDVLAHELAVGCDADQYLAALAVQEGAERLGDALQLGGRALELKHLGLALGDE